MHYDIQTITTKLKGTLNLNDTIYFPAYKGDYGYTAKVTKGNGFYLKNNIFQNGIPLDQYLGGRNGYRLISKMNGKTCDGQFPEVKSLAILTSVAKLIAGKATKAIKAAIAAEKRNKAAIVARYVKETKGLTEPQRCTYIMLRKHHRQLGCNKPAVVDLLQAVLGCTFPESVNQSE